MLSPQAAAEREGHKRRAESPIPEDDEAAPPAKKRMTEGPHDGSTSPGSPPGTNGATASPPAANGVANGAANGVHSGGRDEEEEEEEGSEDGSGGRPVPNGLAAAKVAAAALAAAAAAAGDSKKGSHDTEKLVDAMLSDGVGTMLT
jgi:hypothetical protein